MVRIDDSVILIETKVGKYVWWPILQLIDFIPKGKRESEFIVHLDRDENTELGAMIKATTDMLKKLKLERHNRKMKDTDDV